MTQAQFFTVLLVLILYSFVQTETPKHNEEKNSLPNKLTKHEKHYETHHTQSKHNTLKETNEENTQKHIGIKSNKLQILNSLRTKVDAKNVHNREQRRHRFNSRSYMSSNCQIMCPQSTQQQTPFNIPLKYLNQYCMNFLKPSKNQKTTQKPEESTEASEEETTDETTDSSEDTENANTRKRSHLNRAKKTSRYTERSKEGDLRNKIGVFKTTSNTQSKKTGIFKNEVRSHNNRKKYQYKSSLDGCYVSCIHGDLQDNIQPELSEVGDYGYGYYPYVDYSFESAGEDSEMWGDKIAEFEEKQRKGKTKRKN